MALCGCVFWNLSRIGCLFGVFWVDLGDVVFGVAEVELRWNGGRSLLLQSLNDGGLQGCDAGDQADRRPEARYLWFA